MAANKKDLPRHTIAGKDSHHGITLCGVPVILAANEERVRPCGTCARIEREYPQREEQS